MAGLCFQYWEESEVIHVGAEASVSSGLWLGIPAVLKSRRRRGYRHVELDDRLTKSRISVEAKVLSRLQITGFSAPRLLQINQEEGWMVLSKLEGNPIYQSLIVLRLSVETLRRRENLSDGRVYVRPREEVCSAYR